MEGKRLAIDSSIWPYQVSSAVNEALAANGQFQATMRDKDGRVLVNAHVLGMSTLNLVNIMSLWQASYGG